MKKANEEALVDKYRKAEREITAVRGPFSLFGLFRHEETPGKLDLIVAAPWLAADRSGLLTLAPHLPRLTPAEGGLIGRIIALDPDDAFVRELREVAADPRFAPETEADVLNFTSVPEPGFPVMEGYMITPHVLPKRRDAEEEKAKAA